MTLIFRTILISLLTILAFGGCKNSYRSVYSGKTCRPPEETVTKEEGQKLMKKDNKRRHKAYYRDPLNVKIDKYNEEERSFK